MNKTINLGILAHVDAGKTTVTEALLHASGVIRQAGRVDHGDTVTDSLALERRRGITIRAATVSFEHRGVKFNLLDTPGHMDFVAEVERSLRVLDACVLVVSAREGVQAQTRVLIQALSRLRLPTLVFLNKLDRPGADVEGTLAQLRPLLPAPPLLRQGYEGLGGRQVELRPLSLENTQGLLDALFDLNEEIARLYLEEKPVPEDLLRQAYRGAVAQAELYPVYLGAALMELGVAQLLDAFVEDLTPPTTMGGELSAEVCCLRDGGKLGRLCYARLYAGSIRTRETLRVEGKEDGLRVRSLLRPRGAQLERVDRVDAGDIAVLAGENSLRVGDWLGRWKQAERPAALARPMLQATVHAQDREALWNALESLALEDPLLELQRNPATGEIGVRVFGQVQMEVLRDMVLERHNLLLRFDQPQTLFREKPLARGECCLGWRDSPFAAAMTLSVEPLPSGSGLQYKSRVDYGYLTQSFQNAVQEGVLEACAHGNYGWPIEDALWTLEAALYDSVSSTPADYRQLAPMAVLTALERAGTLLLEPLLAFELELPEELAARALYDVAQMRGRVLESGGRGGFFYCSGEVPLDSSKTYGVELAAYTKGRGSFTVRQIGFTPHEGDPSACVNRNWSPLNVEKYLLRRQGRLKEG